jgi:hypothetical protein
MKFFVEAVLEGSPSELDNRKFARKWPSGVQKAERRRSFSGDFSEIGAQKSTRADNASQQTTPRHAFPRDALRAAGSPQRLAGPFLDLLLFFSKKFSSRLPIARAIFLKCACVPVFEARCNFLPRCGTAARELGQLSQQFA